MAMTGMLMAAGSGVAVAESISFSPAELTLSPDGTGTVDIVLDSAPTGLSGYDMNVTVPGDTAEITSVSFPGWASLNEAKGVPSGSVRISGLDLNKNVEAGATNIVLATLTLKATGSGTGSIHADIEEMDADGGAAIAANVNDGKVTVSGSATATPSGTQAAPSGSPTATPGFAVTMLVAAFVCALGIMLLSRRER